MNKVQRCRKAIKQLCFAYIPQINLLFIRNYSIEGDLSINVTKDKRQSKKTESANFEQISQFSKDQVENNLVIPRQDTFASLLRHSKFIDLGNPEGKIVLGEIFHIINDDLYIDFGWKFHCVCPRPQKDSLQYKRGSKVKLLIKDLELSTRFLGASTDLTMLEADCILLGLVHTLSDKIKV
ncbi:28S ribosomal protein S28, mitochondrial [Apis florea]|uniref:28S ribosomal protein S28, mitochondrial n=1 Tax=Apis florea TaxID=7463 RepID=UPI000252B400|nr:28S ribosomal protein S28, mitochondrial [Apis florea]